MTVTSREQFPVVLSMTGQRLGRDVNLNSFPSDPGQVLPMSLSARQRHADRMYEFKNYLEFNSGA